MNRHTDGQAHGPIYAPFVMDAGVDHKSMKAFDGSRRSLVPDPSRASGVRPVIPPRQRYRVIQPVVRGAQQQQQAGQLLDTRYRRPRHANGEGELIGANVAMRPFTKTAQFLPTKTKKRTFYDDGDDETLAQRILAQRDPPPKLEKKPSPIISFRDIDDNGMPMHIASNIEVPAQPSTSHHSEGNEDEFDGDVDVDIDGMEEVDAPRLSPNNDMSGSRMDSMDHLRGASLRDGGTVGGYQHFNQMTKMRANSAAVKQLNGENCYLKDQLDASFYRAPAAVTDSPSEEPEERQGGTISIKQLETLLMDRNMRLKQLLSENLKQGAKIRRLEQELGEDAAAELMAGMEQ